MSYRVEYLESVVREDIPALPKRERMRIRRAIETRLEVDPIAFGKPLRYSLKGVRRLRVGDCRVIYRIESKTVVVLKIGHRREVYE